MDALDRLIEEARAERLEHAAANRQMDAAASAIREKALLDARVAMVGSPGLQKYRNNPGGQVRL